MVLNDGGEGRLVLDRRDPAGKLRVPDGGVATDQLVVGDCPVDESIKAREAERITRALNGVPLAAKKASLISKISSPSSISWCSYLFSGVS